MPLVKRNIEPRHLCRGALPDGVTSELECVTNSTLAAIIKQLGSLSRHAEDIFGELFNEANSFYLRMSSLQERVDQLAVKVTQLDSTVEEVSLQDINMRKAFKSSTIQDQQVVSRTSVPNPVVEMYHRCDKPPPLNILSPYRDDKKDALKFYTDSSYFFNLWKEKMLQATEDKRKEKRRQKGCPAHPDRPHSRQAPPRSPLSISEQQRQVEDPSREVKKVRKARNRRQEWNVLAYDKEFRPDARLTPSPYHGMSSEGSLSPDSRSMASDSYPASPNHPATQAPSAAHPADHHARDHLAAAQTQSLDRGLRPANQPPGAAGAGPPGRHAASLGRTPSGHGVQAGGDPTVNGPRQQSIKEYRAGGQPSTIPEYYIPPAPPPPPPTIPSAQTAFDSATAPPSAATSAIPPTSSALSCHYSPSPPPPPANYVPSPAHPPSGAPPAAPPPPPPGVPAGHQAHPSPPHAAVGQTAVDSAPSTRKSTMLGMIPMSDARSDLLAAIRRGIQLRKVQEQREQEAKREPVGNDVATILSRRIAVEYSESDDDSELDENEWSD
ncbi:wiskott-Aldrich syndrome protein family member 3-like isoform X1 [Xiphophorus maculatus]|uniref:Wiskott-Aldrich syndrome protein family member n=1 Tax=Xiphophorus maculatus TaxID=8083 RepID=A0A3B5Q5B6_XIPMA|nr:wiskott-Aldrich syndrome protein family member 3-like isoform X1 [Xiphophorus maculatus]XP_023202221.1 wiskott-Aldrich syndrome protein family member 3-like isoform X1 [Xiphophorus maculatus]XP_023202223.1 wiskott-Aldrich syndrome protein family member 3-like isoform X1 [Xiphophorus maculatus]XP_027894667.1 wiskott-Aldrich syndrome protein family member 3-like isoform X1 [Xiphophorus couchianus]XP_027894668.1 wiskott-Aldrich syndrome protein family member 3-like isoform X1 [Xiphophorus couch